MTEVAIVNQAVEVTVEPNVGPAVTITVPVAPVVSISAVGIQGPAGAGGASAATFTHDQPVAAMVWTIDHGLGHWPLVVLLNEAGDEIEGTVRNPTLNRTTATFSEAIAGSARIY